MIPPPRNAHDALLDALAACLPGIDRDRLAEILPAMLALLRAVSRSGPPDPPREGERPPDA